MTRFPDDEEPSGPDSVARAPETTEAALDGLELRFLLRPSGHSRTTCVWTCIPTCGRATTASHSSRTAVAMG